MTGLIQLTLSYIICIIGFLLGSIFYNEVYREWSEKKRKIYKQKLKENKK